MDIEARTRDFLAALGSGPAAKVLGFLAPNAVFEAPGLLPPINRAKLDPMLERAYQNGPPARLVVDEVKVKRNVAFAGWSAEGLLPGLGTGPMTGTLVVSWDQQGKVVHLAAHLALE